MASEVQICNVALASLGEDPIIALTENSKAGRLCNLNYTDFRDSILRSHNWNFATKRVELALEVATPPFGFDNQFALPADNLRVIGFDSTELSVEKDVEFQVNDGKFLTNNSTAKIEYIARVTDPNLFDALFREYLSAKLASRMARPLTDSKTQVDEANAWLKDMRGLAPSFDAKEGTPGKIEANTWINSRS